MLSSGLQSPFNYTRRVKDGPSIIYMAGIQGEIRDVYVGERGGETKWRNVDLKESGAAGREESRCGIKVNGKEGEDETEGDEGQDI